MLVLLSLNHHQSEEFTIVEPMGVDGEDSDEDEEDDEIM